MFFAEKVNINDPAQGSGVLLKLVADAFLCYIGVSIWQALVHNSLLFAVKGKYVYMLDRLQITIYDSERNATAISPPPIQGHSLLAVDGEINKTI